MVALNPYPNGSQEPPPAVPAVSAAPPDLRRESVAGGEFWYMPGPRSLAPAIDDVAEDFGSDIYERMQRDPQVATDITVLKTSILEDGMQVRPAIEDKADPDYQLAIEIHDEAREMLAALRPSLTATLWDLLSAIPEGNAVAETTYDDRPGVHGRTLLNLVSIKVKPRTALAFVVDPYFNIVGFMNRIPGQPISPVAGMALAPGDMKRVLPREKFIVLSHRPRHADPRGTSVLRPVFGTWTDKREQTADYRRYLTQFANPSLLGYTPENPPAINRLGPDGQPLSPERDMFDKLVTFRNSTVATFPGGSRVQPIEMQGEGRAHLRAFDLWNRDISKVVLTETLASEEGQHQARAAAQVHQDSRDTVIRQDKLFVQDAMYWDALRVWVRLNWGAKYERLAPIPTLGVTERHDQAQMLTAAGNAMKAGYFYNQAQLAAVDAQIGVPVRDLDQSADLAPPAPAAPAPPPAAGGGAAGAQGEGDGLGTAAEAIAA